MRAARLPCLRFFVPDTAVLLSGGGFCASLGGISEGVVEGIEGAVRLDRELEAVSKAGVLDRDRERVLGRMPEQRNVDAVAFAGGQFASPPVCRAHASSFSSGR